MVPTAVPSIDSRKGFRSFLHCDRTPAVLLAFAITISLSGPAQSATQVAPAPITVTNSGSLLSAEAAPIDSIATVHSLAGGLRESVGAITLSSKAGIPGAALENTFEMDNMRVSPGGFVGDSQVTAPSVHLAPSDSGSFATSVWEDETAPFEDVTPVPEPSTWLAAFSVLALLIWQHGAFCRRQICGSVLGLGKRCRRRDK